MTVLGYMTELGMTTEQTAKWQEIHVTAGQADTVGLVVLGTGLVLLALGRAVVRLSPRPAAG